MEQAVARAAAEVEQKEPAEAEQKEPAEVEQKEPAEKAALVGSPDSFPTPARRIRLPHRRHNRRHRSQTVRMLASTLNGV